MSYCVKYTDPGKTVKNCCQPLYDDKQAAISDAESFCNQKLDRWVIVFDMTTGKQVWALRND
jgi:hypothetical protein